MQSTLSNLWSCARSRAWGFCAPHVARCALLIAVCLPIPFVQGEEVDFISVAPKDSDLRQADEALRNYLIKKVPGLKLSVRDPANYSAAINDVRFPSGKHFIARLTPYPLVAARMLGAKFEEVAVYQSKATGTYTYNAYFVVKRDNLDRDERLRNLLQGLPRIDPKAKPGTHPVSVSAVSPSPTPKASAESVSISAISPSPMNVPLSPPKASAESVSIPVVSPLSLESAPATLTFKYHDKFSTSSYFVPSLYFREHHVFTDEKLSAQVLPDPAGTAKQASSWLLVKAVLDGQADLAAVWDGTMTEATEKPQIKDRLQDVQFVKLPTTLPNDILVCDDDGLKKKLQAAIKQMNPEAINKEDVNRWLDIEDVPEVRAMLVELYRKAVAPPSPVTVQINAADEYLEAAREAIRLSGTELVEHDPEYHIHSADIVWTLEPIHDQAVRLHSKVQAVPDIPEQTQDISYLKSEGDLTRRLGNFIHSRMHRIRYVWPYQSQQPVIIRDVDFVPTKGSSVWVQPITWIDPDRDEFTEQTPFKAHVVQSGPRTIELNAEDFRNINLDFDPMSLNAFRVVLQRPSLGGTFYNVIAWIFVGLFIVGVAVAMIGALKWRQAAPPSRLVNLLTCPEGTSTLTESNFADTYNELVKQVHDSWRNKRITEADVIYCSREELETYVQELNANGAAGELVGVRQRSWKRSAVARIPFLKGSLNIGGGTETEYSVTADPQNQPAHMRIGSVIQFGLKNQSFSGFIGQPIEWLALHCMVGRALGLQTGTNNVLRDDSPTIEPLISQHFCRTISDSEERESLFVSDWQVSKDETQYILRMDCQLPANVVFGEEGTTKTIQRLSVICQLGADKVDPEDFPTQAPLKIWILGRRIGKPYINADALVLKMRPLALLQD